MIKKIWQKIFETSPATQAKSHELRVLARDQHHVSRTQISKNALKVLYRLNSENFEAYLVGGGVRDILLGLSPKDFDIATNATPEQVGKIFRNSRLIGRRFRLAHILFGREVIEVATFRASHQESSSNHAQTSTHGLLVRDNVYGNLEEDAFRRDFTVNALYYCAKDLTILDYTGGLEDLEKRQLRLIGDPVTRYQEDPVRILRAIRLASKLELTIEKATAAPIPQLASMLEHVSSARLWDECNKLLLAGHAQKTWLQLMDMTVAEHLFQQTTTQLNQSENAENFHLFVNKALESTDKRIAQNKPVTPAFLFAVFLWEPLHALTQQLISKGLVPYEANQKAAARVLDIQRKTIAMPKRFSIVVREIWNLQSRLVHPKKRGIESLLQHPRFRAAYDFLCLRAHESENLETQAAWWTKIQDVPYEAQQKMIRELSPTSPKRKHSKTRKKRNTGKYAKRKTDPKAS